MMSELRRALEPLHRKLRLLAGRAVLRLMSDAVLTQVEGLADEVRDAAELFQQYGHRSMPLPGAEGIMLSLGGSRDHTVVICVGDRRYHVVTLASGEVCLEDYLGKFIHLKADGSILVKADTKVRMEVPLLEVTGEIKDHCDSDGRTMAEMRNIYNGHQHNDPQGGSVSTTGAQM